MNIEIKLTNKEIKRLRVMRPIRPYRVKIQLTNACNARCRHCNVYKLFPKFLSTHIVEKLIISVQRMGCEEIDFTGGEPTLHPDFLNLFKRAKEAGLKVKINTNGYLINEFLAKEMVKLGLRELAISIDSHIPKVHNSIRGLKNGWQRVIRAISLVDKYRKIFNKDNIITVYSIIHKNNYRDTPKILDLKKIVNFDEINFIPIKNSENRLLFFSKNEIEDFYSTIRPLLLRKYKELGFTGIYRTINDPFEILFSSSYSGISDGKYTEKIYRNISCFVPNFYAYIMCDGSVVPCCVAPHRFKKRYIIGNIYRNSFDKIWNSKRFNLFRKSLKRPPYEMCKTCSGHHTEFNIKINKIINEKIHT